MSTNILQLKEDEFDKKVMQSDLPVLLDFGADWCPPCVIQAPILEELAERVKNKVRIYSVNVDESRNLAMQFGIQAIPTLILFNKGEVVKQWVGLTPKDELEKKIAEFTNEPLGD